MREILGKAKTASELLQCYERNPGFRRFIERTGLPSRSREDCKKADLEERNTRYRMIAERVWNPDDLLVEPRSWSTR